MSYVEMTDDLLESLAQAGVQRDRIEAMRSTRDARVESPGEAERLARAAEGQVQPSETIGEREFWYRTAEHFWGLA